MTGTIFGFIALLSLFLPGFLTVSLLAPRESFLMKLSPGYLIGSSLFTLILFVLNSGFGLRLTFTNTWLVYLGLTFCLFLLNVMMRIPLKPDIPAAVIRIKSLSVPEIIVGFVLVWILGSAILTSVWYPVTDWDAITLFDYRAKVILATGSVGNAYSEASLINYPFYTSLMHFWVNLNGLKTAMPVYPLFTAGLISSAYLLWRRYFSSPLTVLFPIILISAPKIYEHSFIAYTNLPYAVFVVLGAGFIYHWQRGNGKAYLWIGILLSLASFWARGFPFALVNFILIAAIYMKKLNSWKWWAVLFAAALLFTLLSFPFMAVINVIKHLKWSVMEYFWPYPLILVFSLIAVIKSKKGNWFWPALVLGYIVVLIIGTVYMSGQNPAWYLVVDAIQRMAFFINLAIMWLGAQAIVDYSVIFSQPPPHPVSVLPKSSDS